MANNKTTYVLQFDAELGALEKKLNSVKGLMSGILGSAQAPKGLDKSFEKLGDLIEKIRQKASQPIESKGGFTSIGKDINAANTALNGMLKIIKSIDSMSESAKISFLPPEAQEQLKAIVKSLTDYASAIDAATTETAELIKARNDLAKAEESVSKAKNKVESRKGLLEEAKAEKEATKQSIEAIKQRKDKLTELRKEQEKIERFYNTIGEDGNKPNRSKKYDGVSMRPQDIKRKIAELESASVGDADALVELQENYKKASNNVTSYINQLSAAERALKDSEIAHGELTEKVGQLEQAFKEGSVEKQEQAFKQLREEAKKLGINLEDIGEGFSEANADALIQKFVELKQKGLDPLNEASNKAETNVREMGAALDYTRKKTDDAADSFEQMTEATRQQEAFENKIKQFLGLAGAAQVMRHALRDAMQTISDLDKTMTQMSVVTDLSVGDYWDQLPQYTKRANELGLAIGDVYKADTLFYQQGLKTNEVVAISTETMKMAQIAGLDTAEATDRMTAALRGFNMELDETNAKRISDVYSELAAITAADVDEISTAMTKTASIASSAGMEFETTAAFLSQIIETTRESAETAGTAMKTVIARFQELKKAPDEIGEIDGEIVDANAIETALRSVGVELRESGGQFRELDDVFLELSSKWDGLDKNTQRYIATIAAGSRQQSRFIAMMSDYARTQELVTSANNSAGASSRQFEKTAESLQFKINKLKNAWHEFTMGIMESDLVKFGVDILTKFLEIVNKITSAFGGFAGSITKIGSIIAMFKLGSAIFEKIKPLISQFLLSLVDDFKDKGEKAGRGYAFGLKKGVEAAEAEGSTSVKTSGTLGRVENKGVKGYATNAGLSVMEAVGVGHFADAREAHLNVKQAKTVLGTNAKSRAEQLSKYQNNKQKLESLQEKMTIHKNGTASKKGKQGLMTKEEVEKAQAEIEDLTKSIEEYEQAGDKLAKNSEQQWNSITAGLQSASMAAAGVGMAFGAIGQAFTDAGFEGMGKVLSGIGTVFMILSTTMTFLSSILPVVSAGFAGAGAAGTASGIATTASWSVVGLIVMAVMAGILVTVGIILLILNAVKNASPEKKLEEAQEAAEKAAEAADKAAEAYDKLTEALEGLEDKYDALEDLTRGTKEWNAAMREINSSVLDLIDKYPELAKFVENIDGVLTIDVQSEGVQETLKQAEAKAVIAKNQSIMSKVAVAQKEDDVKYNKLTSKNVLFSGNKEQIDLIAEKISSGNILSEEDAVKEVEKYYKKVLNTDDLSHYQESIKYDAKLIRMHADELKDYGDSLYETELQQEAAYGAIAAAAQSLANTLNMTEEQIKQSQNLVDEDLVDKFYKEEINRLNSKNGKSRANDEIVKKAIEQQYGEGATIDEYGKVKDRKGTVLDKLNKEQVVSMAATYQASQSAAIAIENSDEAIAKVASVVGSQIGNAEIGQSAINAMYMSRNGGALTQEDLLNLQSSKINFEEIWKKLTDDEKLAYGNDIERLKEDFSTAIESATDAFNKAGGAVRGFMTADIAKGFSDKLEEVAELAGGDAAKQAVQKATDELLLNKTNKEKQEIQSRINMTDWANQEQLLALQIDLEQQYGYTTKQAEEYVNQLGIAAYATSGLSTTVKIFGELWKATEKINQSLTRLTKLQWEYDRAIEGKGGDVKQLVNSMLNEYAIQATEYQQAYNASNDDIAKIYAQGGLNYKIDLRDFVQLGTNGINVDEARLQDAIDSGKISEDEANDWLEKLNNQYATSQEQIEGLRTTLENIEELEQQGEDAFYELRSMAKEAILGAMQEQIDLQRETLAATQEANAQLINKIQEQIDDNRQARAKEEAEENIANLQARQAYLGMDTSGANSLQMLDLDKQIAEAEQNYRDSLVDQAIQNLQDANTKAEEQRERQISIAESSLAEYEKSNAFQQHVDQQLSEMLAGKTDWANSSLGELIKNKFTEGMSSEEAQTWADNIGAQVGVAENWKETNWGAATTDIQTKISTIENSLNTLAEHLTGKANSMAINDQASKLASAGFDLSAAGVEKSVDGNGKTSYKVSSGTSIDSAEQNMNKFEEILNQDANYKTSETWKTLESKGLTSNLISQTDYYKQHSEEYLNGGGKSYTDYLDEQLQNSNKDPLVGTAFPVDGDFIIRDKKGKWEKNKTGNLYMSINGKEDNAVRHSGNKADDGTAGALDNIVGNTGYKIVYTPEGNSDSAEDSLGQHGTLWIKGHGGKWASVKNAGSEVAPLGLRNAAIEWKRKQPQYKTGGLADFTGPAWLDGTKSRPEYVLNAAQTERFFSLVDILEKYEPNEKTGKSGDNYFEIEINVEKLENDYDVEKVADKIRRMIYEDASYRNVNTVGFIR